MAVSSVPSVKRLGGAGLLLQGFDVEHVLRLALGQVRRQRLLGLARRRRCLLRSSRRAMSSTFQPTCCTALPEV